MDEDIFSPLEHSFLVRGFMTSFRSSVRNALGVSRGFEGNILSWKRNHRDNRQRKKCLSPILKIFFSGSLYSLLFSVPHYYPVENVMHRTHAHTHSHEDIRRDAYITLHHTPCLSSAQSIISTRSSWSYVSSVHVLNSLTKHFMSGQWEYLLSLVAIIQNLPTVFSFFVFTIWCYSSGIQSLSPNLSPLSFPLFSNAYPKKDWRAEGWIWTWGSGVCVGHRVGIYSPP